MQAQPDLHFSFLTFHFSLYIILVIICHFSLFFFIDDDDLFDEDLIVKTISSKGASNVVDVEENDNE